MSDVSTERDGRAVGRFPDFLCIGAQKAGTTWLYDNLRGHPQIWLPPVKELHYFNHVHIEEDRKWTSVHRRKASAAALRRYLGKAAPEQVNTTFVERLTEVGEGAPDDEWYARIFGLAPQAAKCGDITPRYASLPPAGVDHVYRIMPNAKIIYILRDPIDRCWSHIRMLMAEKQNDTADLSVIEKMAQRPGVLERSNYPAAFETWSIYQSEGRFLALFFDDIANDPVGLLKKVCEFLGVAYEGVNFRNAQKQVHAGLQHAMPPAVHELLKARLRTVYEDLARRFPARGEAWVSLHYGA